MPRTIQISAPSHSSERIIEKIASEKGILSIRLQRGISLTPVGDVISVDVLSNEIRNIMVVLEDEGILDNPQYALSTSTSSSMLSNTHSEEINTDGSQTIWEETLSTINEQSQMTYNNLLTMLLSGMIALMGLATNAIHVVIGASLLAPGFGAVVRISLGLVNKHTTWKQGLKDVFAGYAALLIGATITAVGLKITGTNVLIGSSSYLPQDKLVDYFTTITVESVLVSVLAAIIGTILILTNRTLLTAGVMMLLALVTSASIATMAFVQGDYAMGFQAVGRWFLEFFIIAGISAVVFLIKKHTVMNRNMKI
jgi:hypothetical protein